MAYTVAVREKINSDADIIDVKIYGDYARKRVMELVKEKITLSGSENKTDI
jgi:fructose/tagatose bisphosphate aldolase